MRLNLNGGATGGTGKIRPCQWAAALQWPCTPGRQLLAHSLVEL